MALLPFSLLVSLGQTGLMGPIAVAAYSYMALVPIIQPPIMKLFTTKKERAIKMQNLTSGIQAGENLIPNRCYRCCMSDPSDNSTACWYADAW